MGRKKVHLKIRQGKENKGRKTYLVKTKDIGERKYKDSKLWKLYIYYTMNE